MGGPHARFEKPRRRPKAAVVAGVEPRRGREIGGYQEVQCVLPRRWVVDLADGEHHVDGDTFSGGRWLGRWWRTPVGAANSKLNTVCLCAPVFGIVAMHMYVGVQLHF